MGFSLLLANKETEISHSSIPIHLHMEDQMANLRWKMCKISMIIAKLFQQRGERRESEILFLSSLYTAFVQSVKF